jgi:PAS domain S-box-containing protein
MMQEPAANLEQQPVPRWRAVFVVVIALLLVSSGLALHQYFRFSGASSRIDRTHQIHYSIDGLLARLLDAETGARGYLLTGDERFLEPFTRSEPLIAAASAELVTLVEGEPDQLERARRLESLSRDRTIDLRAVVDGYKAGRTSETASRIAAGFGKQLMDEIRLISADMKAAADVSLRRQSHDASLARRISLVFAIATLLLAATLGMVGAAVDRSLDRRRAAFEDEMAGRLRAESSMLSATQELTRTERITRSILDNSGDCIQILEPDGTLVSMNLAGVRLMDVDDVHAFSLRPWAEHWSQNAEQARAALASAVHEGEGRFHGCRPTARGAPKWWDVLVTPVRDEAGRVTKLLSIARDISEQKRAEEERNQLLDREREARSVAERATQLKDEFLATLSHELRTPLNSIVGWVGVLKQDQSRETLRKAIDVIDRNSRRQAQMIDDLLDVSRIVSGKLPLDVQRVDLGAVIDAAVASARPAADAKGVRLTATQATMADVQGDPVRLQQMVWNLVSNAVKFTARDGTVRVTLHAVDGLALIEIADSGQGIAADVLPHIFERFQQADSSSTRTHGGLGLGLAIVKNLSEMHGGSVIASSPGVGRGSTFTVLLPLSASNLEPAVDPVEPPPRDNALLANVVVMVVDDEADARDLVQRLLEDAGARVSVCDTARAALQTIHSGFVPDVIVSDVAMPEQDGYDFIRRVRQMKEPISSIPAAALTALARLADRRRALLAGFQTHLTKPVDATELVATVASLAGRTGKSYV